MSLMNENTPMSIVEFDLERQRDWSWETFGPPHGCIPAAGVLDHIRKELAEIEEGTSTENEWVDVIILALDGAMREGWEPLDIIRDYHNKMEINRNRQWPDWRTAEPGKAIEHIRDGES